MKYIVLMIAIIVFTGSFLTLKNLYKGGKSKGAERVVSQSIQISKKQKNIVKSTLIRSFRIPPMQT